MTQLVRDREPLAGAGVVSVHGEDIAVDEAIDLGEMLAHNAKPFADRNPFDVDRRLDDLVPGESPLSFAANIRCALRVMQSLATQRP